MTPKSKVGAGHGRCQRLRDKGMTSTDIVVGQNDAATGLEETVRSMLAGVAVLQPGTQSVCAAALRRAPFCG